MMDTQSTPFVWLTLHGQLDLPVLGMPTALNEGPMAVVCQTDALQSPLSHAHTQATLLRAGHPPETLSGYLPDHIKALFGENRGPHFFEPSAHDTGWEFSLSEIAEGLPDYEHGPWIGRKRPVWHIWLRDGLAWRHAPCAWTDPERPRLGTFWTGPLPAAALNAMGAERATAANVGITLLDAPIGPTAHWKLHTQGRAQDDLALVHTWAAARSGENAPYLHISA